ncbi:MAG: 2-iminoacetate synthase ThiH, partial [Muribaculaceae bacterium]|nr:2-iminoacetate synthase ThiH [Muribaculaceae bacterium]
TNSCLNGCVYCGFNHKNKFRRVILTPAQIEEECKAIKELGPFENLLIVTGENPKAAGVDYIESALKVCRKYFSNLTIEVMPLSSEEYFRLRHSGLNGVVCFQETYNREKYKTYHPTGMKSDFEWRVNGFDRMGLAGVHKIGMGVLIGLEDWRTDVTMMAIHLDYLKKRYWKTRYSVNFPRMRPSESGFPPNVVMTDRELAQLTFAFRLFEPDLDISYSTRENHVFRNNMATLGVTTMSAGSKTEPGGYSVADGSLEQFAVSDSSSPEKVASDLRKIGLQPVWKDWDEAFNNNYLERYESQ